MRLVGPGLRVLKARVLGRRVRLVRERAFRVGRTGHTDGHPSADGQNLRVLGTGHAHALPQALRLALAVVIRC